MLEMICVQVPEEFADELAMAGFAEVDQPRLGGYEAQAVVTFVTTAVGFTANVATIVVAKDKIADFVRLLRSWMWRRTGSHPGSEFVIEVTSRSGGSELWLKCRRPAVGVDPLVDTAALMTLLHAVFAGGPPVGGVASNGSTPPFGLDPGQNGDE